MTSPYPIDVEKPWQAWICFAGTVDVYSIKFRRSEGGLRR
jgi:hypothetical protein